MDTRRERARPLAPEERREAIVAATRPLLYEHGRATTTRLIAEAAGIAEGTVFRAFATKEELFDAVLRAEFDPAPFLEQVAKVDPELELRDRLVAYTTLLQRRFVGIFTLMAAMGLRKPPDAVRNVDIRQQIAEGGLAKLLERDADRFTLPVDRVVHMVRLLTFSGSHPHISDQQPLAPEEIVDVILHGVLREETDS
ncbi:TetR/AcrR family transcriptional regulator [Nocardioides sp. YIM 152315]|uniref:TetR/AcrR family transcriptional regulator n=1 Tax=Nocardioides sp. YIM 152315 TaxID=3031760 RepID=UPI0023DBB811|nr:TetR/AcrR family transcriptional regulator [Nocardioides sp. YIM 152315]MDF1605986.1 helix-turn-helix domain containing protein [Nocardioides sp. YIM 152315]